MPEQFEYGDAEGIIDRREINGNTYIVAVYYTTNDRHKHAVIVWADERTGENHGFPDHPNKVGTRLHNDYTDYDMIVREKTKHRDTRDIDKIVSQAVNRAVCQVEEKLERERQLGDMVDAAIRANEAVHGGIDYALENG